MITTAVLLLMPALMSALALVAGECVEPLPNKDDLWQQPGRSSLL